MTTQIQVRDPALLGAMTDEQKKLALYIAGGTVTGIVLFIIIRQLRKKRRAK